MAEQLALGAAATFPSGRFQEHNFRASKEVQKFLPLPTTKTKFPRSDSFSHDAAPIIDDSSICRMWMLEPSQYVKLDSAIRRPVMIDVQGSIPVHVMKYETKSDMVLFNFGIIEEGTTQQNAMRLLMPRPSEERRDRLDFPPLSDLVGIEACKLYMHMHITPLSCYNIWNDQYLPSLIYSRSEVYSNAPPADFLWDLGCSSQPKSKTDGLISLPGTTPKMKDLLSLVQEFYPSKSSGNQSSLVPNFTRSEASGAWANIHRSSLKQLSATVTPIECPKKVKSDSSTKKRSTRKAGKERDIYRRSYLHAGESLLSLIIEKRHGNAEILSLVKSDPELPQLLSQLSTGVAGTGLAVLFSVGCKISSGRVAFCGSNLLNTGVGLGLVWLSWAVNKLRDTVIYISKHTSKVGVKDREMIRRVDQNVNEMFFRAATIVVFAMLKFA